MIVNHVQNNSNSTLDTLFIWDFDHTIVLDDTDYASVHTLNPSLIETHLHNRQLVDRQGWTAVMNAAFESLFNQGYQAEDIINASATHTNLPQETASAISAIADKRGMVNAIVSDSNSLFIEACLKRHHLSPSNHFQAGIFTNSARIVKTLQLNDQQCYRSQLVVTPHTKAINLEHTCETCPANLCKKQVVEKILNHFKHPIRRVCYVGDGSNDYCGVRVLCSRVGSDVVLFRKGYGLERRLDKTKSQLGTSVTCLPWDSPGRLRQLIDQVLEEHQVNGKDALCTSN